MLNKEGSLHARETYLIQRMLHRCFCGHYNKIQAAENTHEIILADLDLKLQFIEFVNSNEKPYVEYAIDYLIKNKELFDSQFDVIHSLILHYQHFGMDGYLKNIVVPAGITNEFNILSCVRVDDQQTTPEPTREVSLYVNQSSHWYDKIFKFLSIFKRS